MTKAAALHEFFAQFNLNVWPENSVPTGDDAPNYPYLTYQVVTGAEFDKVLIAASLWYRETTWTRINAKTEEIARTIGGAYTIECDNGGMILRRGTPFGQPIDEPSDDLVKRKALNIEVTYCTPY